MDTSSKDESGHDIDGSSAVDVKLLIAKPEEQSQATFHDENEETKNAGKTDDVPPTKAEKGDEIEDRSSPRLTRSQSRLSPVKGEVLKLALPPPECKNKREAKDPAVGNAQDSGSNKKRCV